MFGSSAVLGRECTECIFIKAFSLSTAATERTVKLQSINPKQRDKWRLYTLYTWGQLLIRWSWRHELYYHNSSCLDDRMQIISCVCTCVSYPAIFGFIKYLWGERVPRGRPGFLWDILPHPLPVSLVGCDVTLLELDLIGRQEAHHILLLLFNLCAGGWEKMVEGEVVG